MAEFPWRRRKVSVTINVNNIYGPRDVTSRYSKCDRMNYFQLQWTTFSYISSDTPHYETAALIALTKGKRGKTFECKCVRHLSKTIGFWLRCIIASGFTHFYYIIRYFHWHFQVYALGTGEYENHLFNMPCIINLNAVIFLKKIGWIIQFFLR